MRAPLPPSTCTATSLPTRSQSDFGDASTAPMPPALMFSVTQLSGAASLLAASCTHASTLENPFTTVMRCFTG